MAWPSAGVSPVTGERVVAEDILGHPDPQTALVASYGIQAYACHPLQAGGHNHRTQSFGTRTRVHFSEDDHVADEDRRRPGRHRDGTDSLATMHCRRARSSCGRRTNGWTTGPGENGGVEGHRRSFAGRSGPTSAGRGPARKSMHLLDGFFQHTITRWRSSSIGTSASCRSTRHMQRPPANPPPSSSGKEPFSRCTLHDENKAIFEEVIRTGQPYRAYAKRFTYPDRPSQVTYWDWQLTPSERRAGPGRVPRAQSAGCPRTGRKRWTNWSIGPPAPEARDGVVTRGRPRAKTYGGGSSRRSAATACRRGSFHPGPAGSAGPGTMPRCRR